MKLLGILTAASSLVGFSSAHADEQLEVERELEQGWAKAAQDESAISVRANAVITRLGDQWTEAEELTTVYVAALDGSAGPATGNGSEGCIFMARPGSRIREWRCYYPNEGEKALNRYQFREEIREAIQMQQAQLMREAEIKALLHEYRLQTRR